MYFRYQLLQYKHFNIKSGQKIFVLKKRKAVSD